MFHGILQPRILEWVAIPSSSGSSRSRDWTQVSHIAGRFFTSWATREAKNTRVGSLSLVQWVFPTQESNRDLLHCRQILYQRAMREEYVVPCPTSPTQGTWVWAALGVGDGQGSLVCCNPWGRKKLDMTDWTNYALFHHNLMLIV